MPEYTTVQRLKKHREGFSMPIHAYPLFLPGLGIGELSVLFIIILVLFGPGKLPEVFRAMGDGVRQFKSASRDVLEDNKGESPTSAK
jgi:sec-independent protein translocase protein TatA